MLQQRFQVSTFLFLALLIFNFSCASKKKMVNEPLNQVISTAKSYTGTPYKYGGTTRSGIDCSALVYHSFYSVGINMPRTSALQSEQGESIKKNEIKPGDLLFSQPEESENKLRTQG